MYCFKPGIPIKAAVLGDERIHPARQAMGLQPGSVTYSQPRLIQHYGRDQPTKERTTVVPTPCSKHAAASLMGVTHQQQGGCPKGTHIPMLTISDATEVAAV